MCTWPTEKKRRFLREATETDGGKEIDGESGVSRVVAREQAFEERLQSPGEKIALFTRLTRVRLGGKLIKAQIHQGQLTCP